MSSLCDKETREKADELFQPVYAENVCLPNEFGIEEVDNRQIRMPLLQEQGILTKARNKEYWHSIFTVSWYCIC